MPRARMFIEESSTRLQLTPMIDVTFQLLIFFMVVSEISDRHKIESTMQQVSGGSEDVVQPFPEIRIRLDRVDTPANDGSDVRIMFEQYRCKDIADLRSKLLVLKEDLAGVPVIIDGGPEVPFEKILQTLDACKFAEYRKVQFARPREVD
ncbi:MAG: biopolymer transporter ExbD [Planctomycetota bacterium]|nr:biopolymer transporter ExbD [Planctomycetota bacterium]MDP7249771.1 biopolymer transporter ExbD [Planctomycetota bacterium]